MNTVMTPPAPLQLTSWTPPPWATTVMADGDLIVCSRPIGVVPHVTNGPADDVLSVMLVQRDEIRADLARIEVFRHPVEILVGGVSLSSDQAQDLSRLVENATALIAEPAPIDLGR